MKKNLKWIIFVLIVIVAAIFAIFYLDERTKSDSQTPLATETLQYSNAEYSVSYPAGWEIDPGGSQSGVVVFTNNFDLRKEITILVTGLDTEEQIRQAINLPKEEAVEISGLIGTRLKGSNKESGASEQVIFVRGNNGKLYTLIGNSPEIETFLESFKIKVEN